MKYAWLVARREFAENAKTKGFWFGILMFPLMLLLFGGVPVLLNQRAVPERNVVILDQTGQFEPVIRQRLERLHQRKVLQALNEYATRNARGPGNTPGKSGGASSPKPAIDLESVPAPGEGAEKILEEFAETNPQALDRFAREGGRDAVLARIKPFVREDAPPFKEPRLQYRVVSPPSGIGPSDGLARWIEVLRPFLRGETKLKGEDGRESSLFAAVLIPADVTNRLVRPGTPPQLGQRKIGAIEYWAANLAENLLFEEIERAVNAEVRNREFQAKGMDPEQVRIVNQTSALFTKLNPKKAQGKETVSMADYIRQWAPSGFVYLLWVAIFSVAQMLLNNVIEEKSNKIIEVLLSSVTPGELMMGKLFGIAAVGITMICSWVGMLVAFLMIRSGPEAEVARQLLAVIQTSPVLPFFILYFILGYLLYAGLILSLGSICNTLKEAQNYMAGVMLILSVPLVTMTFIPRDPNGTLATVLSWIPLYTPFVMMNRATADPPMFEVVGTLVLLVVFTGLALWLSGKVFRIGILRTGQPPRLVELLRWIRSK